MEHSKGFISVFMSAISNCMLYSKNHAFIDELIENAFSKLGVFLKGADHFEIMIIENDLIINKNPAIEIGLQGKNLIKRLKTKGISHIEFSKGITLQELKKLVADISNMGKELKSTPHIKIGIVGLHFDRFTIDRDSSTEKSLSSFTSEQLKKIEEEVNSISPFKKLNVAGFEEIVFEFVVMLKKKMNILKLLRPVQADNGLDYNHATNVAVLTLFQAQALGIKEEFHRDIGLAALLHDVGKLFITKEMHKKKSSLAVNESEAMKLHPFYGAQYLAKINDLAYLAPIVAFQHHLRYDGRGYPQLKRINIKQHICSQITAISDSFDNLRITTHYGRALDIKDALVTMKTKDEGLFNPFLIDNFIRSIHLALSG
jgi:HD-GYP domain-containing protein (c-di-GMP phosphodiesterase class II)